MTRREAERLTHQQNALVSLGFTHEESEQLRRISMTLQRWFEHECNGTIQRDESGVARWGDRTRRPVADRERGALKRLAGIIKARNERKPEVPDMRAPNTLSSYIQGDPRGAALYIIRPGDVPKGADVGSYYSRGICVY